MIVKSEKYWADLLEQYKLGSISDTDRFELEKRALDDPFLFDALEGYSTVSQDTAPQKKEKTKLLTLPRMAAAASLVFLVAMIFLLKNDNTEELTSDQSIAMVLDKSNDESQSTIEEEIEPETNIANTNTNTVEEAETYSSSQNNGNIQTTPIQNTNNKIPTAKKEKKEIEKEEAIPNNPNAQFDKPEDVSNNNTGGKVTSSDYFEETKSDDIIATTTEDEVVIPEVAKKLKSITNKKKRKIDNLGSQATADNNSSPPIPNVKEAKKEESSTFYIVEPAIGKKDFEEFVKESIDNRGLRQEAPQDVTIEFDIDKNGELSGFLHIYNGCSECGGYAIYLLSSSGVWKTTPVGQEGRARYTLKF